MFTFFRATLWGEKSHIDKRKFIVIISIWFSYIRDKGVIRYNYLAHNPIKSIIMSLSIASLKKLLAKNSRYLNQDKSINISYLHTLALECDDDLLALLVSNDESRHRFFLKQEGYQVFVRDKFIDYIYDKDFLANSYTKYKNKIGLNDGQQFLKKRNEVVLHFPFKDCILEGGQSKDDQKREEIYFNEVLAHKAIDQLLSKKLFSAIKHITPSGEETLEGFHRNEQNTITDNLIIKGNNLIALHSIKHQFRGKVKLIYIDPPYNTGNDSFHYNDRFNHSTWLVFMKNRLEITKELLRDDGVIFVQCDDNEQAYLKVLMDEVFGRDNFVNTIVWRKSDNQANIGNIARVKEYIILFCKKIEQLNLNKMNLTERAKKEYRYKDEKGYFRRAIMLHKTRGRHYYEVQTPSGKILNGPWMKKEDIFKEMDKNNQLYWTKGGDEQPYGKIYLEDSKGQISNDFLGIEFGTNQEGANHINEIFSKRIFDFSKPETLISHLIQITTQKGDIVLDYHVGSGTTAAVAHKMGRQYIGIEQMDYIEDITVERLKKVIDGFFGQKPTLSPLWQ